MTPEQLVQAHAGHLRRLAQLVQHWSHVHTQLEPTFPRDHPAAAMFEAHGGVIAVSLLDVSRDVLAGRTPQDAQQLYDALVATQDVPEFGLALSPGPDAPSDFRASMAASVAIWRMRSAVADEPRPVSTLGVRSPAAMPGQCGVELRGGWLCCRAEGHADAHRRGIDMSPEEFEGEIGGATFAPTHETEH